jgi:hypothetical protein
MSVYGCKVQKLVTYDSKKLGLEDDCQASKSTFYYDSILTPETLQYCIADSTTKVRFSLRARNIAASVGAMPTLNKFAFLEKKSITGSDSAKLALLYVRQEIDERLSLALLDLSSVLAEIDCERERAIELRSYLQNLINRKVKTLNIASIVVGSAGAIAAGTVSIYEPDANKTIQFISITAAIGSGYWALRQIFIDRKAYFSHNRNHLTDIWEGPKQSAIYPPTIWHFINKEFTSNGKITTGRQILIKQFEESGLMTKGSKQYNQRAILFFGKGGNYNIDDLSDRINMLELLETEINLMKYDLKRLHQEIIRADITNK